MTIKDIILSAIVTQEGCTDNYWEIAKSEVVRVSKKQYEKYNNGELEIRVDTKPNPFREMEGIVDVCMVDEYHFKIRNRYYAIQSSNLHWGEHC